MNLNIHDMKIDDIRISVCISIKISVNLND